MRIRKLAFTMALLGMLCAPVVFSQSTVPPAGASHFLPPAEHPHIRAAINELEQAKHELETAAHDFGGHRVQAIRAIDEAIKQLREALKYAR
jgi:hypothetical protein